MNPQEATPVDASSWPGPRTVRMLCAMAGVCIAALFALGALMDGGPDKWQSGVSTFGILGDLTIALPSVNGSAKVSGLHLLVILGDPRVFTVAVVALAMISFRAGDKRLAAYCFAAPMATEVIVQFVAKPSFFSLFGGHYGYPSGHTAAAACLAIATWVVARRLRGPAFANRLAPFCVIAAACTAVGVVVTGMHPLKDAYGALLFSAASMAIALAVILHTRGDS